MTDILAPKGTEGRVYGGLEDRVHITDGQRGAFGQRVAAFVDQEMRAGDPDATDEKDLCPGCYMIALVAAAMTLAKDNGQSLVEMGRAMAFAFSEIADEAERTTPALPEEMTILPFADPSALALVRSL